MSNKDTNKSTVAVGIDVGLSQARVAVSSSGSTRVVSNRLGHRSTLAMACKENDKSFVFGDAALKSLQKEKKPTPSIRSLLMKDDDDDDDDDDACQHFMGHLCQFASDATASTLAQLRVVLSVPVDASSDYVDKLKGVTEAGVKSAISEKKHRKHHVVVGVVSDPVAVCVAHGLTSHSNILVIDAGASGLTISHLQTNGSSSIFSLTSFKRLEQVSGPALVTLLAKHVASQFERQYRIPTGDVWDSKKAKYKLLQAAETALQGLSTGRTSIHITIDGLYEGMDCHIPLSKPRWEMLSAPLLRQAETFLQEYSSSLNPDAVLLVGSLCSFVKPLVDKMFPDCHRGNSKIVPEEAVAIGCACHAESCLEHNVTRITVPTQDVVASPVAIAIGTSAEEAETIIAKGTPLPAHVVHTMSCSSKSCHVWQKYPSQKLVADLENLPKSSVEVLVELSVTGTLSIAVQGGPVVTI